jgi:prepilin-type N-terminal cleavage/methylation domain-containing protein
VSPPARRLQGEAGFTLLESLVAMALSAVMLAFVTGTVVSALRAQRRQTGEVAALNDAKLAFERVTRDIRGADPLTDAAPDRITLAVRSEGTTVRTVTYERAAGAHSLVATEAATGARTLVGNLAPGQPLFLFHLTDGSTTTGAPTLDLRSVVAVTVRLQVAPEAGGPVVDLTNRVTLRNPHA